MSKHTPGPWNENYLSCLLRFGRKNSGSWDDHDDPEKFCPDEDDARLIAAAPDLLATAQYFLAYMDAEPESIARSVIRTRLKEVIAKATGAEGGR